MNYTKTSVTFFLNKNILTIADAHDTDILTNIDNSPDNGQNNTSAKISFVRRGFGTTGPVKMLKI